MLQRILVGLDGSPLAETILPYVSSFARCMGGQVTLLHVTQLPEELRSGDGVPNLEQLLQRARLGVQQYLDSVEQRLRAEGLSVHSVVSVGDAAAEIVRLAQRDSIELIALATHGRSGLQRWTQGSVAEQVVYHGRTPLLLIRPGEGQDAPAPTSQVVVPLDGSPLAESILPLAEAVATRFGVSLVLLRAIQPVHLFGDPLEGGASGLEETISALREAAAAYLAEHASRLAQKGLKASTVVADGPAVAKIADFAHSNPGSLVVMGTHGRTGMAGAILGSVARGVVQQATCPVLLVRPTPASG